MKKIFGVMILFIVSVSVKAQTVAPKQKILYGSIQKADLLKAPFADWFTPGYDDYQPDPKINDQLTKLYGKEITIQIFLGTWCGDSKREVPRLLKILDETGFPEKNLRIIGLGSGDSLVKQSPQHEEEGQGIFRVPTVIVYRKGIEINRINEFPVLSLEHDLYAILNGQTYVANYKSFATIKTWLADGTMLNKNNSTRGLALQLRPLTDNEHELNSLAYLLLNQGKKEEALKIFQVNYYLYPESANVMSSLGEGYCKTGDLKNAVALLERSLEINKDPKMVKEILAVLYEAKGVK
jgi:tetratricopeptide (TPR) repeat protein